MEIRTQLAIVTTVGLAWGGGNLVRVRPFLHHSAHAERLSLAALEQRVARNPEDLPATRVLLRRYLELGMPQVVVDQANRAPSAVQQDGVVALYGARAQEALGHVDSANALVTGALNRCGAIPLELAEGSGCDVRTQTELSLEGAALDLMQRWRITPLTDPSRASVAHEMATRPVRISTRVAW
ncbi:MAG: hypothetical protein HY909_25655 [Deltaproteobacteria bacterium]|nr:hypothetical protein [Deltaproteobacteria bacterium]